MARPDGPGSHPTGHAASGVDGASRFDPSRGETSPQETVLLVADGDKPLAYLELSDASLAAFARHHLMENERAAGWDAGRREMPLVVSSAMHAKIALIRLHAAVSGDTSGICEFRCYGVSWANMPDGGDWRITVERLPRDSDRSPEGMETGTGSTEGESAGPKGIAQPFEPESTPLISPLHGEPDTREGKQDHG